MEMINWLWRSKLSPIRWILSMFFGYDPDKINDENKLTFVLGFAFVNGGDAKKVEKMADQLRRYLGEDKTGVYAEILGAYEVWKSRRGLSAWNDFSISGLSADEVPDILKYIQDSQSARVVYNQYEQWKEALEERARHRIMKLKEVASLQELADQDPELAELVTFNPDYKSKAARLKQEKHDSRVAAIESGVDNDHWLCGCKDEYVINKRGNECSNCGDTYYQDSSDW